MFGIGMYLCGHAGFLEMRTKDRTHLINASFVVAAAVNIDDLFEQGEHLLLVGTQPVKNGLFDVSAWRDDCSGWHNGSLLI
jgi:hypothetical protein